MSDSDRDHYRRLIEELFCDPNAEFPGYELVDGPVVLVPGVLARAEILLTQDTSERYELNLFDGVHGFSGELWERSARALVRTRPLAHPGLPEVEAATFLAARDLAFTLTKAQGQPVDPGFVAAWARHDPTAAFEKFSLLMDALKELHDLRILHRGLLPGAIRMLVRDGEVSRLALGRFEMSTFISNIVRRVAGGNPTEVRQIIRSLYLQPDPGCLPREANAAGATRIAIARHLAYIAPEMHQYLFDERTRSRRNWEGTDLFGLGVFGWELFCGAIQDVLPDELEAVAAAEGADRVAPLAGLNRAMHTYLYEGAELPVELKNLLGKMLKLKPDDRGTVFEMATRLEYGWDAIHYEWDERPAKPYLVAFMPEDSVATIYEFRKWISRSPEDPAGRAELKEFFERELRQGLLAHSITGASGYATGREDRLREAEWLLIGEKAVWFCSFLRVFGNRQADQIVPEVLLIKWLRDHEYAQELSRASPRRRLPPIELFSFRDGDRVDHLLPGRPSWEKLTESVRSTRVRDSEVEKDLKSLDFLLDYQRVVLEARTYPFVLDGDPTPGGTVLLKYDAHRDAGWRHRSPLLTAYADPGAGRRPLMGDFFQRLERDSGMVDAAAETEPEAVLVDIDPTLDLPSFTKRDAVQAQFVGKRDADTIEVRILRGTAPARGWIRPKADVGSRPQLARQLRARQALQQQLSLVRSLRKPISHDIGQRQWTIEARDDLRGNAPEIIRDMLSLQPVYVLQGPPGSGKTKAASEAVRQFLAVERAARVLVSAQSNFALDNLAESLVKVLPPNTVLRVTADRAESRTVAESIQPYTIDQITVRVTNDIRKTIAARLAVREGAAKPSGDGSDDDEIDEDLRKARRALSEEWLASVQDNQVELGERLRSGVSVVLATCSLAATIFDGAFRLDEAFDWVIVEEAAKAWPTELIIPLVLGPRWTLIGDHRQLGAHRGDEVAGFLDSLANDVNPDLKAHHQAKEDRLRVLNLFGSFFTDEPKQADDDPTIRAAVTGEGRPGQRLKMYAVGRLRKQFRMHPDIAEPVGRVFYPVEPVVYEDNMPVSFLESDLKTTLREHGVTEPGVLVGKALVWLNTDGYPDCVDQPLWRNEGEVDLIDRLVTRMKPPATPAVTGRANEDDGLVVLTPYRAQVRRLRKRASLAGRVYTVHSFQGHEADRVVVSLVRSTRVEGGLTRNVGHVGQDEVVNVLLSRARRLLVLVGNFEHFATRGGPNWAMLTRVIDRYGTVVPAASMDQPGILG
jgi:hypothetical protein